MRAKGFFEVQPEWTKHWKDMPEFRQEDREPHSSINVQFRSELDRRLFLEILGEKPSRRKSIWYPKVGYLRQSPTDAAPTVVPRNRYPVYVPSKGRWESRLTSKAFEKLGMPYRMVVEPQEYDEYAAVIGPKKLLVLPFRNQGLAAARNWIWNHAEKSGTEKFWTFDDNIDGFYRLDQNLKVKVVDENPLIPVETFCARYENVVIAGLQYEFFATRRSKHPPFTLNTWVYSNMLILTDARNKSGEAYRNECFFNDDTDLCIRVLKDGWCTVLFNAFLCKKMPTMKLEGGMTGYYQGDGRYKMAKELADKHPDIVKITKKWGRYQHQVDYSRFTHRNRLRLKPGHEGEGA